LIVAEQVDTVLPWAKMKKNQELLDSDFLTSDKHLKKFLGYPSPGWKVKPIAAKKRIATGRGKGKAVLSKGKERLVSDKSKEVTLEEGRGKVALTKAKGKLSWTRAKGKWPTLPFMP
jgi:hypothetical protein